MGIDIWIIWMILAALFIIVEIFTAGFFILCFGIGAAVAGVLALLGAGAGWQLGAFIIVSGIIFLASRRFADKVTKEQPPGIGADRFVGKEAIVLEKVDNDQGTGRVRMGKDEWRVESQDGSIIAEKTRVHVVKVDGTHLIVKPLEKGN